MFLFKFAETIFMRYLTAFLLLTILMVHAQKYTLSGVVRDEKSNETIIGASLVVAETGDVVFTNSYGFYSITISEGNYTIEVTKEGYQPQTFEISLDKDQKIDFKLYPENGQVLQQVEVTINSPKTNIRKAELSVHKIPIATIKKMPVVLGEVDILRSLTFLPGVTNGGEASTGINVRGGAVDQNLIQLDEAVIFNSSHLFGFFSVFNPDAIKDLKLYKGGIPARYGGRVASVLDIYQRDGNSKEFKVNGGIGLVTSRLLLEGPIKKEKTSFLVAGRGSYAHLFLRLFDNDNLAYFYDLNTKITHKFNDNNSLFLSGYFGRDVFRISNSFTNTYGNAVFNLRWNHVFNDKLFSNLSAIYSDYYYGLDLRLVGFDWNSGIQNLNIKYDFTYFKNQNYKLLFGYNGIYHEFNPGEIYPRGNDSGINFQLLDKRYALENAFYLDNEWQITDKLQVIAGLRWSIFHNIGPQPINIYANNQPVVWNNLLKIYEKADPIGTQNFDKWEVIRAFNNFEPRFSLAYAFNDDSSVKFGYNRMAQYLHLISNTQAPTPLDVWAPSGKYIEPQILDQVAIGYFRNLANDKFSLEVETFYKIVQNRLDYIDGADLIANNAIEQVLLNGKSRAYGLEVLFRKNTGRLQGWISYTLSRAEQQTPGRTPDEFGINNGKWYRSPWDRRHNFTITTSYKLSDSWSFGANFTYNSGQAVTYPIGQFVYEGIVIPIFGERNAFSLPDFHHLDISAIYTPRKSKNKRWKSEWVFGIYNVYNRRNAAFISFGQNEDTGERESRRLAIFGIVPSISYNFRF